MTVEDFNLADVSENWWNQKEISEKDKQRVAEDWKKAKSIHKSVKKNQQKNWKLAEFLSKILWRYYNNPNIINHIHELLQNIDRTEKLLYNIFSPFVFEQAVPDKIANYISSIQTNKEYIGAEEADLIWNIIEAEKLWGELFWKNLNSWKSNISYEEFKNQIKNELMVK